MADESPEGTGFTGPAHEGTGFEGPGFSSQDEFIGTLGTFGEPVAAPSKWRIGRKTATAVGIAVALGAGGYGIAVAASSPGPTSNGAAAQPVDQASTGSSGPGPACGAVMM